MILVIIAVILLGVASFVERIGPVHPGWLGAAVFVLSTITSLD